MAYFRSAQVPFAALVLTKEAQNLKFDDFQVIEMKKTIDNNNPDTYSWLCYLLSLPNDHLIAETPIKFEKYDENNKKSEQIFTEIQKINNLDLAFVASSLQGLYDTPRRNA